jgi:hypothetical protein
MQAEHEAAKEVAPPVGVVDADPAAGAATGEGHCILAVVRAARERDKNGAMDDTQAH